MRRLISTAVALVLCCAAATAQQAPERSLVRKGNRQYDKGNYQRSIERYEAALKAAPGNFEAAYDLGNACYRAELFEKAEQTMRAAAADTLRTDGERAEAFYNLGNAQFRQQKYQEALESYKQSLRLDPSDMEAKYNYAYTKRLLDQNKDQNQNQDQKQDQNQNQGQGQNQDQQQDQNQNQGQNQDQSQNQNQDQERDGQADPQQGKNGGEPGEPGEGEPDGEGEPRPQGISPQEQERMLDAIQAQEDQTQDKLKEKARGVVVRGRKNW